MFSHAREIRSNARAPSDRWPLRLVRLRTFSSASHHRAASIHFNFFLFNPLSSLSSLLENCATMRSFVIYASSHCSNGINISMLCARRFSICSDWSFSRTSAFSYVERIVDYEAEIKCTCSLFGRTKVASFDRPSFINRKIQLFSKRKWRLHVFLEFHSPGQKLSIERRSISWMIDVFGWMPKNWGSREKIEGAWLFRVFEECFFSPILLSLFPAFVFLRFSGSRDLLAYSRHVWASRAPSVRLLWRREGNGSFMARKNHHESVPGRSAVKGHRFLRASIFVDCSRESLHNSSTYFSRFLSRSISSEIPGTGCRVTPDLNWVTALD